MKPIRYILKQDIIGAKTIDLERVCAYLEHHKFSITITNNIISDCGDRWVATAYYDYGQTVEGVAATLRDAMIVLFEQIIKEYRLETCSEIK